MQRLPCDATTLKIVFSVILKSLISEPHTTSVFLLIAFISGTNPPSFLSFFITTLVLYIYVAFVRSQVSSLGHFKKTIFHFPRGSADLFQLCYQCYIRKTHSMLYGEGSLTHTHWVVTQPLTTATAVLLLRPVQYSNCHLLLRHHCPCRCCCCCCFLPACPAATVIWGPGKGCHTQGPIQATHGLGGGANNKINTLTMNFLIFLEQGEGPLPIFYILKNSGAGCPKHGNS